MQIRHRSGTVLALVMESDCFFFHILRPLLTTHKSANSSVLASVGGCAFSDLFIIPPKRSKSALCLSIFVILTPSVFGSVPAIRLGIESGIRKERMLLVHHY